VIGADPLGDAVLADLRAAGVQLDAVVRDPAVPTSGAVVLIASGGERSFFYRNGGNETLANRHVADDVLKTARIVHVGGGLKLVNLDLADLMRRAKSCGAITSLDTDWDVNGSWMRRIEHAMPHVDYFLTNQEEAAMLTGRDDFREAATALLSLGPKAVVIKRGACGASLVTRDGLADFPAYRVTVHDTTCAGDAFVAGFLWGIDRGGSLDESMRQASAAGALCTTQVSHRAISCAEDVVQLASGRRP
jgi:sugar/nucleoside kinase (ribokinase family)